MRYIIPALLAGACLALPPAAALAQTESIGAAIVIADPPASCSVSTSDDLDFGVNHPTELGVRAVGRHQQYERKRLHLVRYQQPGQPLGGVRAHARNQRHHDDGRAHVSRPTSTASPLRGTGRYPESANSGYSAIGGTSDTQSSLGGVGGDETPALPLWRPGHRDQLNDLARNLRRHHQHHDLVHAVGLRLRAICRTACRATALARTRTTAQDDDPDPVVVDITFSPRGAGADVRRRVLDRPSTTERSSAGALASGSTSLRRPAPCPRRQASTTRPATLWGTCGWWPQAPAASRSRVSSPPAWAPSPSAGNGPDHRQIQQLLHHHRRRQRFAHLFERDIYPALPLRRHRG